MPDWTNSAKAELERYCARTVQSLAGTGADPVEVIEDIKRHLDVEIQTAQLKIVTEDDVRRFLGRIGEPAGTESKEPGPAASIPSTKTGFRRAKRPGFVVIFFGVLLPVFTFLFEINFRSCAQECFDPLPTIWHELIVSIVPLANLLAWLSLRRSETRWQAQLQILNGFSLGVALAYSLRFLPLGLLGILAIPFLGIGLLPLTPLLSLCATVSLGRRLRGFSTGRGENSWRNFAGGFAGALVIIAVLALPTPITRHFEHLALSESPESAATGIRWLRTLGSEGRLLQDCYGLRDAGNELDFNVFNVYYDHEPISAEAARQLYFRVTGNAFNHVPRPALPHGVESVPWFDDYASDPGQGGDSVAGCLKGLSLNQSRLDAHVEPDAALAYCEWTLEFRNVASTAREARAQILLPPGSVVSRLTLWINGEEREAAFGGRSQVKSAYRDVAVVRRRDPVLVTTCGPDRILMQCFPVPPNGGLMKVRIGITEPMVLENAGSGNLRWPVILERDFAVPPALNHSVWIDSRLPLKANLKRLQNDATTPGRFVVRGDLSEPELNDPAATIIAQRNPDVREVWAAYEGGAQVVRQRIVEKNAPPAARVVLVLDGSIGVQAFAPAIADAIGRLPEGLEVAAIVASDTEKGIAGELRKGGREMNAALAAQLRKVHFAGGQDNVPALVRAWDLAAGTGNSLVVWIHGPQPVVLTPVEALRQRLERSPFSPRLCEIQTKPGPNRVAEALDGLGAVSSVPRFGKLADDLAGVFSGWDSKGRQLGFERELAVASAVTNSPGVKPASDHVARLYAYDRVLQLAAARDAEHGSALAANRHLVTPVSGAVVLETQAQYAQNGLTPADPATVPVIASPEPATWALLLLGGLVLFSKLRADKRRAYRHQP